MVRLSTPKQKMAYFLVGTWCLLLLGASAYLGLFHYAAIRVDGKNNLAELAKIYPAPQISQSGHTAYHILYSDCGCSQRTAIQLLEEFQRVPSSDAQVVVLVGTKEQEQGFRLAVPDFDKLLSAQHIKLYLENDEELFVKKFGLVGAPSLAFIDKSGALLYSGGYAPFRPTNTQKISFAELRRNILTDLGHTMQPYPIFGCVIGKRTRQASDPFRLKQISMGAGI